MADKNILGLIKNLETNLSGSVQNLQNNLSGSVNNLETNISGLEKNLQQQIYNVTDRIARSLTLAEETMLMTRTLFTITATRFSELQLTFLKRATANMWSFSYDVDKKVVLFNDYIGTPGDTAQQIYDNPQFKRWKNGTPINEFVVADANFVTGQLTLRFTPAQSEIPFKGEKVYRALHIVINTSFEIIKGFDLPGSSEIKMPEPVIEQLTNAGFFGKISDLLEPGVAFLDPASAPPGATIPERSELSLVTNSLN